MRHRRRRSTRPEIKKLPADVLQKTIRALELPPDVVASMAHFEMSGNREIVVDGCRGVIEYSKDVIKLNVGKLTVRFVGRELELRNLRKDSAIINGYVTAVEFTE